MEYRTRAGAESRYRNREMAYLVVLEAQECGRSGRYISEVYSNVSRKCKNEAFALGLKDQRDCTL